MLIPTHIIIQHVDRYLRLKRQETLNIKTPGVAIIEYEDGETEMVNIQVETFRNYQEDDDEDDQGDNDSGTSNNRQVNNFDLITKGEMIEILWPLADIYFPCKIITYTKLMKGDSSKKRSRKLDTEVMDSKIESIPKKKKHTWVDKKMEAKSQQLKSSDEEERINSDLFSESGNDRDSVRNNISDESIDNYDSDRQVDRPNHDNPLFDDEPKDDSSDNDDDEEESDSDSNEGGHVDSNKQPDPVLHGGNNQVRKLTFEEQWRLKLQRTQEMMDREGRDRSQMSSLMARQL